MASCPESCRSCSNTPISEDNSLELKCESCKNESFNPD